MLIDIVDLEGWWGEYGTEYSIPYFVRVYSSMT